VGRLGATVTAQSWMGHSHNGYLVFDYLDSGNYKYAGLAIGSKKWQIKEAIDGTHYVRDVFTETITIGQAYNVLDPEGTPVSSDNRFWILDWAGGERWRAHQSKIVNRKSKIE